MQDTPTPEELLAAVAAFVRQELGPALTRHGEAALAYHAKVAANMLDTTRRQLQQAPASDAAEFARLRQLLGHPSGQQHGQTDASLDALNRTLAERLAQPAHGLPPDLLAEHLWRTALDKLAVDQPRYATAQRVWAAQAQPPAPAPTPST